MNLKILMLALICFSLNGMEAPGTLSITEKNALLSEFSKGKFSLTKDIIIVPNPQKRGDCFQIPRKKVYSYFSALLEKDEKDRRPWPEKRKALCAEYLSNESEEAEEKVRQSTFLDIVKYSQSDDAKRFAYLFLQGLKAENAELAQAAMELLTARSNSENYYRLIEKLNEALGAAYYKYISSKQAKPEDIFKN